MENDVNFLRVIELVYLLKYKKLIINYLCFKTERCFIEFNVENNVDNP